MTRHGLLPPRYFDVTVVCVFVWISSGFCEAIPNALQQNVTTERVSTNTTVSPSPNTVDCSVYGSSCLNCSQNLKCAWCFSEKSCFPESWRNIRNKCDEDDWYYGDCDKPEKETILVYVLLSCALFLLVIVILLVLYIFFCKMPGNKDYEPVSTKEKKKRRQRTPLMSKKVKPSGSRTEELKKKYQLDG